MSKPETVAEWIRRAQEAGHDALGIANDPEWGSPPGWLYGDETLTLKRISPSLAHCERGWYFFDRVGTAAHGPYPTAEDALCAAIDWRAL